MSEKETLRPIEVGSRWASKDSRDRGRVVEVRVMLGISLEDARYAESLIGQAETERQRLTYFHVATEAAPKNPDAVGNVSRVSERTLRTRYRRVSR